MIFFLKKKKKIKITALLKRHTIVPNIRSSPAEFIDKAASTSTFSHMLDLDVHVSMYLVRLLDIIGFLYVQRFVALMEI